jgi:hypothetical protein
MHTNEFPLVLEQRLRGRTTKAPEGGRGLPQVGGLFSKDQVKSWGLHHPGRETRLYLQGLGQSHKVPLHMFAGLQLSLQPQCLGPLLREEVCELGLWGQGTELGPGSPWVRWQGVWSKQWETPHQCPLYHPRDSDPFSPAVARQGLQGFLLSGLRETDRAFEGRLHTAAPSLITLGQVLGSASPCHAPPGAAPPLSSGCTGRLGSQAKEPESSPHQLSPP